MNMASATVGRCLNCSLRLTPLMRRLMLSEIPDNIMNILRDWISPTTLSTEGILCYECFTLLQNASTSQEPLTPAVGHQSVCYVCGVSILRSRTHRVPLDCPQRIILLRGVPSHQVTWVESNSDNAPKKPTIVPMDSDDDSDDYQQDDEVIFMREVTTPPTDRPHLAKNNHAAEDKPINNKLQGRRKFIDSMKSNSDSDIEIVPTESSTMFLTKINSNKDIADVPRNWLHNIDSKYNNKLQKTQESRSGARRVLDNTSEMNSEHNITRSYMDKAETSNDFELKFSSKYNNKKQYIKPEIPKTQENLNDARRVSDITSEVNYPQSEAHSSRPDTIEEWLAKLDAKYFSTPQKTPVELNVVCQTLHNVSKVNSEVDKTISFNLDTTDDWLAKLKSKYKSNQQTTQVKLAEAFRESDITPKVNSKQNEVLTSKVGTSEDWLSNLESKHKITFQKSQESHNNARQKQKIVSNVNSTQNEALSHEPDTLENWLSKLESKDKTNLQKTQEKLNDEPQVSNILLKWNSEQTGTSLYKSVTSEDWLSKLESKCKMEQSKTEIKLNDARQPKTVSKVNSKKNEASSQKPDASVTVDRLSKLDPQHATEESKMKIKLNDTRQELNTISKDNSDQNEARFKLDTPEDWLSKLGSLFIAYLQEKQKNINIARLEPNTLTQKDGEQKVAHLEHKVMDDLSKSKSIYMETHPTDELPALTPEQEKLVDRALEPEPEDEILVEKFNLRIHRRDLQTLSGLNWLNDEVINFYMNLLMQRSEERKDLPKVYATNTFFYPKLMQIGQAGLRRWTRKVDIFAYDLFVVPVNVGSHWCLSFVDFRMRMIKYLDSQGTSNQTCLDALLQYLKDEHQDKKGAPFDDSGWKTECLKDIPQQMNGSDCGMFACTFAEFSSRNAAYTFTQAHMPYLRRKAALEILTGKLLL